MQAKAKGPTISPLLVVLLIILAGVGTVAVFDRMARSQAEAAGKLLASKLPSDDELKGVSTSAPTPTAEEVSKLIGKKPEKELSPFGTDLQETYSWGSVKKYTLHVIYHGSKPPRLASYSLFGEAKAPEAVPVKQPPPGQENAEMNRPDKLSGKNKGGGGPMPGMPGGPGGPGGASRAPKT